MKPLANWRKILWKAWSIRLLLIAGLLSAIEAVLPFMREIVPVPPGVFALLTLLATFAAIVARLIAQKSLRGDE
jgi:hypothetical protein